MQKLAGQFQIKDWQETTQSEQAGLKRSLANVKLEYSGDISGISELQYLLSYHADGSADFVGFEHLEASVNGQAGSLVLKHVGRFVEGVASSRFEVTQSAIEDKLIGSRGSFTSGENGQAHYSIELS